jgi:hypothetical protein
MPGEWERLGSPTNRDSMLSGRRSGVVAREIDCAGGASLVLSTIASISSLAESCRSRTATSTGFSTLIPQLLWFRCERCVSGDFIANCFATCSILLKYCDESDNSYMPIPL